MDKTTEDGKNVEDLDTQPLELGDLEDSTDSEVVPTGTSRPLLSTRKDRIGLALAILATGGAIFDAFISWLVIEKLDFAEEINPVMESLGSLLGFGPAMVVRAIFGSLLVFALWFFSHRHGREGRLAYFGLVFAALLNTVLAGYHYWGLTIIGLV